MRFRIIFPGGFRVSYEADLIEESLNPECARQLVVNYPLSKSISHIGELAYIFDEHGNLLYSPRDEKNLSKLSPKHRDWILKNRFWIPSELVWKSPYLEITKIREPKKEENPDLDTI